MIVEMAVAADYANLSDGHKLNVLGIFDCIYSPQFPMLHPTMFLAFRLRLEFEDGGRTHQSELLLIDEDGNRLGGGVGEVAVAKLPAGQREIYSQIVPFHGLTFQKPGEYRFVMKWNGKEAASIPLTVGLVTSAPSGQ